MSAPELKPCSGCNRPTTGMCWTDCGMSLCKSPLCEACRHVDEQYGWRHEPISDLPPTDAEVMAHPKVRALVEALRKCEDEIDGYIRHEYPGDHPVQDRYRRRDFAANPARIALAAIQEAKP